MIHFSSARAQIFTTSSSTYRSYGGGGDISIATPYSSGSNSFMRSNSQFANSSSNHTYSTAPICIANGSIKTVASTLGGGVLSDETGFIPTTPQDNSTTTNNNGTIAPPQFAPLHLDWDALLFILLLLIPYLYRVNKRKISGQYSPLN
jgi:hypothetical protein